MSSAPPDYGEMLAVLHALPAAEQESRLRAVGDPEDALLALAEEVERLAVSEVGRALEASDLVLQLADRLGTALAQSRARRSRAQALAYAGRFEEALPLYVAAAARAQAAGAVVDLARAQMSSVHALASLARYDDAVAAGEAALQTFVAAGEDTLAARAHSNLGAAFQNKGEPARALAHFDAARGLLADVPVARAQVDSNRGRALLALDDFAGAEAAYLAALPEFEAADMGWAAAIVEGNLAELYTRQGRLERALHHFERAQRHLERDEAPADLARLRAERADALATLGMREEALREYEAALPALRQHGFALEAARALDGRGRTLARSGRAADAERVLIEAADAYAELGHAAERARLDLVRAELAASRGDSTAARQLAADALAVLVERPTDAVAARYQLARAAWSAGDPDAADAELTAALPLAVQLGIAPLVADLLHLRGRIHRQAGRVAAALVDLRPAVAHVERLRGNLQAERFRAAYQGERLALYDDLLLTLLEVGTPEADAEAFVVAERAKGRALLDLVAGALEPGAGATDGDPAEQALTRELLGLRAELSALYSRLADTGLEPAAADEVARYRREIHAREQRLDAVESRLASTRGMAGLYAPPLALERALALAPAGTALVEYYFAGGRVLAFVLRDGRLHVYRDLGPAEPLTEAVNRLYFQLRRAQRPGAATGPRAAQLVTDVQRELRALHARLLAPLAPALGGLQRLRIIPHGVLHAVPFHALWDGAQYLIQQAEVTFAPSAGLLLQERRGGGLTHGSGALVVGVPDERAPHVADEAEAVSAALGGQLLLGPAARADAVLAAAARADLVHFAGHGFFAPEHPLGSGLKLADRWLTARELYGLTLSARLVTLSGCETGRSEIGTADELVGLVRGFFVAGAQSLLVSLWAASDESTTRLMVRFYNEWERAEGGAAAAWRAAQLQTLAEQPHPAFWAAFLLTGAA